MDNVEFGKNNALGDFVLLSNVRVGDYSYVSSNTKITNTEIGKFCSIGPNCAIGLGKHPTNEFISSHPMFFSIRKQNGISLVDKNSFVEFEKIIIGHDVWIGANVVIKDGITIGDGAIIAAGSVVVKNVPSFTIVAGVPAIKKKMRFSTEIIQQIKNEPWWEKDIDWIKNNRQKLQSVVNETSSEN